MVMLAVEFYQLRLKVGADPSEDTVQVVNHLLGEHATAVFCHKDQVNVNLENECLPCLISLFFSIDRV